MELTQERVRALFDYREDGTLIRKTNESSTARIGDVVGCLHSSGYLLVRIDNKLQKVHRVVFLWHHGYIPEIVDHKDMDRCNNRINNLRESTKSMNMCNRRKQSNNTSGHKGVYYHSQNRKWCSEIHLDKKKVFLGSFSSPEEAAEAYRKAANDLHGEFARTG